MRSKILTLLAVTSTLSYNLESKVMGDNENQCSIDTYSYVDCFLNENGFDKLCNNYNSQRCQNFINDPLAAVPSCQSLPDEPKNEILNTFFNKIIYEAGITSIQCRKDENDNYCSDASGNSADEKLMNVIDDATKSDYCTTIAIENLNWMAHDNKIVGHSNPAIAVVAKRGLKYLKKFSQCQDEVAEIEACFKGDNIDNLCSKYNSSECQTAIADPFKVATSCQSLSEETKNQILRDLYNKVVFKAGIAFIQCQKDEYDNYCSEAFEYFIDEKLMDVIDDVTNSEYCTTVAIESLNWMVHDNKIAGLSNPAVSVVAKRGLEYLKKFSQCLDEVAEIESCFHGDDVNQLCSKYKSSKCQTAISNPFEVATSC